MSRFIFIIVIQTFTLGLFGQQYQLIPHTNSSELLRYQPEIIYRPSNDLIFIGTQNGLLTYDGEHLINYKKNDGTSETVSSIYKHEKEFWIGYSDGSIYHFDRSQLKPWEINEGWPKVPIKKIWIAENDQIWIATYGEGVYVHDGTHLHNFDDDDGLLSNDIYDMAIDPDGTVYLATDIGINVCNFINGQKNIETLPAIGLPNDIITALVYDTLNHHLCIGTYESGLYAWKKKSKNVSPVDIDLGHISYLQNTGQNKILVQTGLGNDKNFFTYDYTGPSITELTFVNFPDVSPIYAWTDDQYFTWILCRKHGLLHFSSSYLVIDTDIPSIQSLLEVNGSLYISNENGLFQWTGKRPSIPLIRNQNILSMIYLASTNEIWCATFGNGIIKYNLTTGKRTSLKESDGLINNSVLSLYHYNDKVFAGTLGGVSIMDITTGEILQLSKDEGLISGYIYSVFVDSKGSLWIGTDGYGVVQWENSTVSNHLLQDQTVYSIGEDTRGNMWFVTSGQGVMKWSGSVMDTLLPANGMTGTNIKALFTATSGAVGFIHDKGMDIVDPLSLTVMNVTTSHGISPFETSLNAISKGHNNTFWVGSGNRVLKINSEELIVQKPTLILKSILAGDKEIKSEKRFYGPHNQNVVQIRFAGIWFEDPGRLQYRYKLNGFDAEWLYTSDHKLIYSNLPPGNYDFEMEVSVGESFTSTDSFSFYLNIKPPFYMTWWFIALVIIVAVVIIFSVVKKSVERRDKMNKLKTDQVRSQLETLKSQINPHFLFNSFNTLIDLIEEEPEAAVEYVDKLSDFYRNILQYRSQDLIVLHEEAELLNDYVYLLKKRFGESIHIAVDLPKQSPLSLVPLTLQILIENAVKHNIVSRSKPLYISVILKDHLLSVTNNVQPKLTSESSTGFGLDSLKSRYLLLTGAIIQIENENGAFTVNIPLKPGLS